MKVWKVALGVALGIFLFLAACIAVVGSAAKKVTKPTATAVVTPGAGADATTAAPAGTPKVGDRSNPVPKGSSASFTNGWTVKVTATMPDGSAVVRAQNQFNDPPPPGKQFYLVGISAQYSGAGSRDALTDLRFSALDSGNTQIDSRGCGVIPTPFESLKEVFSGGTLTGNLCFAVPTATVSSLVMYVDAGFLPTQRAFFALA